jgi:O-acetylhomoserine (thiol)-lyase
MTRGPDLPAPSHLETLVVQAGEAPDPATNALVVPVYQTAAFAFDDAAHAADLFALRATGHVYSRITNPTTAVLEERVTALEGGVGACAVASGMAAITYSVLTLCRAGDNFLSSPALFGGTYNLFANTLAQFGIEVRFVDPDDPAAIPALVDDKTRLVFVEGIGNPLLNVVDIRAWSEAAHACGLPLVVDNTLATPALCRVFEHGADVAVHSATKYLSGHGTTIAGVVVDAGTFDWTAYADRFPMLVEPDRCFHDVEWVEERGAAAFVGRLRSVFVRNTGGSLSPFSAFLVLQGLQTLALRMERHCENAAAVAAFLDGHPSVEWVRYPGLPSSPYRGVAERMLRGGFGPLVAMAPCGGPDAAMAFVDALRLFRNVANVGDTRSLAIHPASTTHSELREEDMRASGVTPDMIRLAVGIEHVDDIVGDLEAALVRTAKVRVRA